MKKLLLLIALILLSSGLYFVFPKSGTETAALPPQFAGALTEIRTAAENPTRQVVITTEQSAAAGQILLDYGAASPHIGVTPDTGISVPAEAQIILRLSTATGNPYYNFKSAVIKTTEIVDEVEVVNEIEIAALPYAITVGTAALDISVEFTPTDFSVTTEICDNAGNTFTDELYTKIRSYITAPEALTIGDTFEVTVDEAALYADELYTLSGIQVLSYDAAGDAVIPYPAYAGAATVTNEFIEQYSKNRRNILVRVNLVKKYRFSIITPTDTTAEYKLTILDDGAPMEKDPSKAAGHNYLVDSGSKIMISTEVTNQYTANDGFAGLPDVSTLTADTTQLKATEFFIKQDSSVKLLITPRVFTLAGLTEDYQLTKNTVSLNEKIGITLKNVPENYGITAWTINGREYVVTGNTVYITADKGWFGINSNFIDMETGIIQIESSPTMSFQSSFVWTVGFPAGVALIMLAAMAVMLVLTKKRHETVKEYLLGTGKTYRTKIKKKKKQAALDKRNAENAEFERIKKEKQDKRNAEKAAMEAQKKAEEEEIRKQNKLTAEEKQAIYEEQAQAAEYKMPGTENAPAAPAPKMPSVQEIMNAKYNMPAAGGLTEEVTAAPAEQPADTPEAPLFNMPPAPAAAAEDILPSTAEPALFNMPPAPETPAAPEMPFIPEPAAPVIPAAPEVTAPVPVMPEVAAPAAMPVADPMIAPTPVAPVAPAIPAPVPVAPMPIPPAPAPIAPQPTAPTMPPPPIMPAQPQQPAMPPRPMMPAQPQQPGMPVPPPAPQRPAPPPPPIPMGQRPQPQPLGMAPGQPVRPMMPQSMPLPPTRPGMPQPPMPPQRPVMPPAPPAPPQH